MKALFLPVLAALALPLAAQAQTPAPILNGNFEAWSNRNTVEAPGSWTTFDDLVAGLGLPPILLPRTVTKATDAHGGNFAAQLQNQPFDFNRKLPISGRLTAKRPYQVRLAEDPSVLPAVLLKTSVDADGNFLDGIPYTGRPARLQFWYKLTGATAAADSAVAAVFLTKRFEAVGTLGEVLTPRTAYTLMDIPIVYSSVNQPDTLRMQFASAVGVNGGTNTVLLVDDVQLVGTVTGTHTSVATAALQVYPNPSATGEFSLASLTDAALSTAPYSVTDATGRLVLRQAAAPARDARGRLVDLRGQRPGVYLLRLEAPAGPVVRKLVVQ